MQGNNKVVLKVEIEMLFNGNGSLSHQKMEHLAMLCANLQNSGLQVMLVSSGAIALGSARLGLDQLPQGVVQKQAVAAVGQAELMKLYQMFFDGFDQMVAQVLLTQDAVTNPVRNRNARATLEKLLERGVIPIINENDSVSTDDIIENDNYPLTLIVANITGADTIVIRTFRESVFQLIVRDNPVIYEVSEERLYSLNDNLTFGLYDSRSGHQGFPLRIETAQIVKLEV